MEELKIGTFDDADNQSAISAHREETNTLKLDKLNNKVTIILIIIPIIIAAILIFAYLGMQETVIDINKEKQNKVLEITKQFGERANAFDVQIAKMNSLLEKSLPLMENKIKKLETNLANLSSQKADKNIVSKDIAQYKTLISQIENTSKNNQTLINESKTKSAADIANINQKLNTEFKKMDEYETSVATTLKDLSILEKKFEEFRKDSITNKTFVTKLDRMNKTFLAKFDEIEQKIAKSSKESKPSPVQEKTIQKDNTSPNLSADKPIVEEVLKE